MALFFLHFFISSFTEEIVDFINATLINCNIFSKI